MYRIALIICVLFFPLFSAYAIEDGTVGERLEMGFYSRIHAGMDETSDILRQRKLSEYTTFAGFGNTCRPEIAWLDKEPMDEELLREVKRGETTRLMGLMAKNNTLPVSNSDDLLNLISCLNETYNQLGEQAKRSEESLASAGMLGLYTDGNTENSDYDITADIEKINSILFTEKLSYLGKVNNSRDSFKAFEEGAEIGSLFGGTGKKTESGSTSTSTLTGLGIGTLCSNPSLAIPVQDMSENFSEELAAVLGGGSPPLGGEGYNPIPQGASSKRSDSKDDFFHTPPCNANFCIKVKIVPTTVNLLGGGKTYSIESLLDKHAKIMEPIAGSNLSAQKMVRNSFKIPFLNIVLKNKVAGGKVYIEDSPQRKKQYQKEYTQEEQEKEFEELRRCAYVSAGLPEDISRANITGGVGYQIGTNTLADNIDGTMKDLSVSNPGDASMVGCMSVALSKSRETYYDSFATDLNELSVFTSSLVQQLEAALMEHKALDNKPIK